MLIVVVYGHMTGLGLKQEQSMNHISLKENDKTYI